MGAVFDEKVIGGEVCNEVYIQFFINIIRLWCTCRKLRSILLKTAVRGSWKFGIFRSVNFA